MAYCVNCGVKLSPEMECCPLCSTRIILPSGTSLPDLKNSLPTRRHVPAGGFDRKLWVSLITIILAAPSFLLVLIDWLFGQPINWSLYAVSSLVLVWIWCISPFLFRRNISSLWITIDIFSLLGFLYFIERFSNTGNWFFQLAFPLTISLWSVIVFFVFLFKRKLLRQFYKAAAIFLALGFLAIFCEFFIDSYLFGLWKPSWSLLVFTGLAAFSSIAIVLQQRQWIVEEIKFWLRM